MTNRLDPDALVALALRAGEAILSIYHSGIDVSVKGDGSPVTAADTAAEAIILAGLKDIAASIPVVAEEEVAAGRVPETKQRFILVDPLDGTREFISRNGEFTVNIALIEDGVPVQGVVYAPALGEIYWGERGGGAHSASADGCRAGPAQAIAARPAPDAGLTVIASRSHLSDETRALVESLPVASFASAGSSLKFCKLAAGEADLYPRLGRTMEWDTAAGDAVLRAAGGMVATLDGKPLLYGKRDQASDSDFANPYFIAAGDPKILPRIAETAGDAAFETAPGDH